MSNNTKFLLGYSLYQKIFQGFASGGCQQYLVICQDSLELESLQGQLNFFLGSQAITSNSSHPSQGFEQNAESGNLNTSLYEHYPQNSKSLNHNLAEKPSSLPKHGTPNACAISIIALDNSDALPFEEEEEHSLKSANYHTLFSLTSSANFCLLTTIESLMEKTIAPDSASSLALTIAKGEENFLIELGFNLKNFGFLSVNKVEQVGQIAIREQIIDFFPGNSVFPLRVEFSDDHIVSIKFFSIESQLSFQEVNSWEIFPAKKLPMQLEATSSIFKYISKDANLIHTNQENFKVRADKFSDLIKERAAKLGVSEDIESFYFSSEELTEQLKDFSHQLELSETQNLLDVSQFQDLAFEMHVRNKGIGLRELVFEPLIEEIRKLQDEKVWVSLAISHPQRLERIKEALEEANIPCIISSENFAQSYNLWNSYTQANSSVTNASTKKPLHLVSSPANAKQGQNHIQQNQSQNVNLAGKIVTIFPSFFEKGFKDYTHSLALITEKEIYPEVTANQYLSSSPLQKSRNQDLSSSKKTIEKYLTGLGQLQPDDFIVHIDHGIGVYRGIKEIPVEGKIGDYLFLEYADEAKLFLPISNVQKIKKFIGSSSVPPLLSKLGSKTWENQKKQAQDKINQLAAELINIYAQRSISQAFQFGAMNEQDKLFAETFSFQETTDQLKAINATLDDLNLSTPMDRLICGDVGFGKTEVALRAAFKVANSGKQVAVLVPTTVLASQHYQTFSSRVQSFPINVGIVNRFYSAEENRKTLAALKSGTIDIIIGTHRLIQNDVEFKDLGLLIIDEEHRFGVAHKEKLKKFRTDIHVLSMSATPIPRTLHLSLSGLREISVIETAPHNRQVIRTHLLKYDKNVVREAILRELNRGGQSFYIHNRVQGIDILAEELSELVPEARIGFAHGQMKEHQLEKIMLDFVNHKLDVLVATTIIESGLDIPNANTIIINQAENFGLAELYQLRGRVGRSNKKAYAYLMISERQNLAESAQQRLDILQKLDDLGLGFKLALQDMEIRGAGNIVGKDQSGQIDLIGFETYTEILQNTIKKLKAKNNLLSESDSQDKQIANFEPEINIGFPAHIPGKFISDTNERLVLYQKLLSIETPTEAYTVLEQIEDRFGKAPVEFLSLIELMVLREFLLRKKIASISYRKEKGSNSSESKIILSFHSSAISTNPGMFTKIINLSKKSPGVRITPSSNIEIIMQGAEINSPLDIFKKLEHFFKILAE